MFTRISSLARKFGATALAVLLVGGAFAGGVYFGTWRTKAQALALPTVYNAEDGKPGSVDFSTFWKAWQILDRKYVASHKTATTTEQDKVWGAIQGLAGSYGDPYTVFFPPKENKEFQNEISGNFEGVGMEMGLRDGIITVIAPLKNTPAYKAGIKPGDKVLKIDDKITSGMSVDDAVSLIRGKGGTTVRLTIMGANDRQPREVSIVRAVIDIPTLDTEVRKDGIYVIRLYNFSAQSAALFRNAVKDFSQRGMNKLVLDLRGNPGGYLDASVDMASWFLPADKIVVKEESSNPSDNLTYKSKGYDIFNNKLKMVVLVDGGSASASEILAGALSENGVATLVGTKTFGKGSVQELIPLTSSTSLKITVARWLTPKGNSISEQGLKPDVEVQFTPADADKGTDPQMNKAVELLLKK